MAGYNIKTGEIFGCKEKSMAWWHEKGHLELHKLTWWNELEMYNQYLFLLVIALLISNKRISAGFVFCIYMFFLILDEFIAWIYCFKHKSEWQK